MLNWLNNITLCRYPYNKMPRPKIYIIFMRGVHQKEMDYIAELARVHIRNLPKPEDRYNYVPIELVYLCASIHSNLDAEVPRYKSQVIRGRVREPYDTRFDSKLYEQHEHGLLIDRMIAAFPVADYSLSIQDRVNEEVKKRFGDQWSGYVFRLEGVFAIEIGYHILVQRCRLGVLMIIPSNEKCKRALATLYFYDHYLLKKMLIRMLMKTDYLRTLLSKFKPGLMRVWTINPFGEKDKVYDYMLMCPVCRRPLVGVGSLADHFAKKRHRNVDIMDILNLDYEFHKKANRLWIVLRRNLWTRYLSSYDLFYIYCECISTYSAINHSFFTAVSDAAIAWCGSPKELEDIMSKKCNKMIIREKIRAEMRRIKKLWHQSDF